MTAPKQWREMEDWPGKYRVSRADGTDRAGGKHEHCPVFVLDLKHDAAAREAATVYAATVAPENPKLAQQLHAAVQLHGGGRRPPTFQDALAVLRRRAELKADHVMVGETEQCVAVLEKLQQEGMEYADGT